MIYLFGWKFGKPEKKPEVVQPEIMHQTISREPTENEIMQMIDKIQTATPPISAEGRQTVPDMVSIFDIIQGMMIIKPGFDQEYLQAIEWLAKVNPDVSNALENILMANTTYTTHFDKSVPQAVAKKMQEELTLLHESWYQFSKSKSGLVRDMITQLAIYGATSTEGIPQNDLNGLTRIVLPSPVNIYFAYDKKTGDYLPMQKIPRNHLNSIITNIKMESGQFIKLNPLTFQYQTLTRIGETPYGVPPFIAALNALVIQKDMVENLKAIINKLGLLGFLQVLLQKPKQLPSQSIEQHEEALRDKLTQNASQVQEGMKKGFMMGYEGTTAEMTPTGAANANGAEKLMDMNDRMVITGLKMDPSMMGKQNTTTETFARVILTKLGTQLHSYQETVATVLAYYDLMHLQLKGFKVKSVTHEFEAVMLGDKVKDEEAYGKKIENTFKLRDKNIIDDMQTANILGYDSPAGPYPEPIVVDPNATVQPAPAPADAKKKKPGDKKTDPANTDDNPKDKTKNKKIPCQYCGTDVSNEPESGMGWILCPSCGTATSSNTAWKKDAISIGFGKPHFDYGHEHECGCSTDSYGLPDKDQNLWGGYDKAAKERYLKTVKKVTRLTAEGLKSLPEGATQSQVTDTIMYHIMKTFGSDFVIDIKPVVNKFVREAYQTYRKDQRPFGKTEKKIPVGTLDLRDIRAIEYYKKSDNLYLGKFITDEDTIKRVNQWISQKYQEGDIPIGRNSQGIDMFKKQFGDTLIMEDFKIRRIVDTTMNRIRNNAAVSYMHQAGVTSFEIVGISDNLQCDFCANLQGKKFKIDNELSKIDSIIESAPENVTLVSPFVTSLGMSPAEVKKTSTNDLQNMGIGAPPFHPHCRDTIVLADW